MLCRWHGRIPGRRPGLGLIVVALTFASVILFLVDQRLSSAARFSPGRDGWRLDKVKGNGGSQPGPPPPTTTSPAPERPRAGPGVGASFTYPDEDGALLSNRRPVLESPDGRSTLVLQRDGNLVLRTEAPGGPPTIVWSTGTGDRNATGALLAVTVAAASPPSGGRRHPVLELSSTSAGARTVLWHSALLPACAAGTTPANANATTTTAVAPGRLELYGSGRLALTGACDLHVPPAEREGARALAVLLSGRYRPGAAGGGGGCARAILAHPSFSTVDVFANVVVGDGDEGAGPAAEAELRECYGEALRAVVVRSAADAGGGNDTRRAGEEWGRLGTCREEVEGVDGRLRGLRDAGRTWWEWSAEGGVLHDTVLAMRADVEVGGREGRELPGFRMLGELREGLVVVRDGAADDVYCRRATGGVGIAPSGHITYGTPASMSHYLNLYTTPSLRDIVRLASGAGDDGPNLSGCEVLPSGPRAADCPRPAACAAECLVAWYLDSVGVGYEVEWW